MSATTVMRNHRRSMGSAIRWGEPGAVQCRSPGRRRRGQMQKHVLAGRANHRDDRLRPVRAREWGGGVVTPPACPKGCQTTPGTSNTLHRLTSPGWSGIAKHRPPGWLLRHRRRPGSAGPRQDPVRQIHENRRRKAL